MAQQRSYPHMNFAPPTLTRVTNRWLVRALLFGALLWAMQPVSARIPLTCLVEAARDQVGLTLSYDPAYRALAYPAGDVPLSTGVCTDVLIRAYRSLGVDLQVLVHEDMRAAFAQYPKHWGLRTSDRNIDHRRVPNLARYFTRQGVSLPLVDDAEYLAGDIVSWRLSSGVPHIGIVSDQQNADGIPLVIHNIGAGTREEDRLHSYEITGHFRFRPERLPAYCNPSEP